MTESVVSQPSKFRFAAFAVVLLLVSGLVVALFDEARAASIEINASSSIAGSTTFTADITVPNGQKLPIASATGIIETRSSGTTVKTESETPTIVAIRQCDAPILGCPTPIAFDADETIGTAITAISLENIYVSEVGSGYAVDARNEVESAYFSACQCDITHEGGYGYATGVGYGYGGVLDTGTYSENNGYGYGYSGEDLILRFRITVDGGVLNVGDYWFTFQVDTGSNTIGTLSSIATPFSRSSVGGGGGGGGATDGDGDGTTGGITLDAVSINPPTGATAAFRVTGVTQTTGQTVTINTDSDFIGQIVFTPGSDLSDATIDIVHYPADTPPPGTADAPSGVVISGFIQITVSSGGTSHTVTLSVTVPQADAEGRDLSQAVLLKFNEEAGEWQPQSRIALTQNDDGSLSGTGTSDCCSDYAVAFDEQDPNVTLTVPSGTLTGSQTLTAEASDNLQVAKVEFYVDDQLVGTDDSEPFSFNLNTGSYSNGEHTVRAVAYDFVDNTAEASQTSSFENEGAPGPGEPGDPSDGGGGGGPSMATILIILVVLAIIGAAGYYFYSQSQKK